MSSTVLAAAIGVSGTVIVGVAGFGAAIWNTRKTLSQARDHRLWEQRANVYVDTLAAIHYRQVERDREFAQNRTKTKEDRENLSRNEAYLARFEPPDWHSLEARLLAFATKPVAAAVKRSWMAHERAMESFQLWLTMREQPVVDPGLPPDGPQAAFRKDVVLALRRDSYVVNAIRREMQEQGGKLEDLSFLMRTGLVYDADDL